MSALLMRGGVDAGGEPFDLLTDPGEGVILAAGPALAAPAAAEVVDCSGMTLLPAPAEPHAHLDKAMSADRVPNPTGDLMGAIVAWHLHMPHLTEDDVARRARAAVEELVLRGTTTIRTHVNVDEDIGLRALGPVLALRERLRAEGLADLQVVALVSVPLTGAAGAGNRVLLREAMAAGADVVGGAPHLDVDPHEATRELVAVAQELDAPIDLHTDETLDPGALALRELLSAAEAGRLPRGAVASHCVSLGMQAGGVQREIAARAAAAGVAVIALPQTNLYLQARGVVTAPARGLTAARALLDAGACLAAGADNVRDPFNPLGRSDALETAALMVMAAHLTPAEAWDAVSGAARRAMGLPPGGLAPGRPAEVLAVRGSSLPDALARASEHRIVVHAGRVVAATTVTSALRPLPVPATPVYA